MSAKKLLAISGSLRDGSSNTQLLKLLGQWTPQDVEYNIYADMGKLPHFNTPDEDEVLPQLVHDLYRQLKEADAVIICTPEYAFGVPGSLKNLLDWTVGPGCFADKPVAIITASSVGEHAHASLLITIEVLSAKIMEGSTLLIPFIRSKINEKGDITDEGTAQQLHTVLDNLLAAIN